MCEKGQDDEKWVQIVKISVGGQTVAGWFGRLGPLSERGLASLSPRYRERSPLADLEPELSLPLSLCSTQTMQEVRGSRRGNGEAVFDVDASFNKC